MAAELPSLFDSMYPASSHSEMLSSKKPFSLQHVSPCWGKRPLWTITFKEPVDWRLCRSAAISRDLSLPLCGLKAADQFSWAVCRDRSRGHRHYQSVVLTPLSWAGLDWGKTGICSVQPSTAEVRTSLSLEKGKQEPNSPLLQLCPPVMM